MMGLIVEDVITEQSVNVDWLIDWFNKVPQSKLSKTFTSIDKDGKENAHCCKHRNQFLSYRDKVEINSIKAIVKSVYGYF